MNARTPMLNRKFGRLVVKGERPYVQPNGRKRLHWFCVCECGGKTVVLGEHLRSGATKSCGCLVVENGSVINLIHGDARGGKISSEHRIWGMMKDRCYNLRAKDYKHYGGRGISVCDRWRK